MLFASIVYFAIAKSFYFELFFSFTSLLHIRSNEQAEKQMKTYNNKGMTNKGHESDIPGKEPCLL